MSEEQPDFRVSDKRKFDAKGNLREGGIDGKGKPGESEPRHEPVPEPEGPSGESGTHKDKTDTRTDEEDVRELEVTFSTFILSLGTQAMIGLGIIPDPYTNKQAANIAAAKQMIDILALLRDKTRGNLEASEITLLDNLLFDLQMHYVELSSKQS